MIEDLGEEVEEYSYYDEEGESEILSEEPKVNMSFDIDVELADGKKHQIKLT